MSFTTGTAAGPINGGMKENRTMDSALEIYNLAYLLKAWMDRPGVRPADQDAQARAAVESQDLDTLRVVWKEAERAGAAGMRTALYCPYCSYNAPSGCLAYGMVGAGQSSRSVQTKNWY